MAHYRKKPVEVEAIRWQGNLEEVSDFTAGSRNVAHDASSNSLYVITVEGQLRCRMGDWLLRGAEGEYWPCPNDVFENQYEELAGVLKTA